ncbi:MAG: hypothetical protein L0I79_06625 [Atopostipes sp.]|nr:hypothetical protein [Atopostipes sp.]
MGIKLSSFFNLDEVKFSNEELEAVLEQEMEETELVKISKFAEKNIPESYAKYPNTAYKQEKATPFFNYQSDLLEAS